jgi:hypothetical protein
MNKHATLLFVSFTSYFSKVNSNFHSNRWWIHLVHILYSFGFLGCVSLDSLGWMDQLMEREYIYIVGQADVLDETYVVTWHAVTELVVILMADMSLKMNLLDRPKKNRGSGTPGTSCCMPAWHVHGYGPTPSLHQLQINLRLVKMHLEVRIFSLSPSHQSLNPYMK